MYNLQRGLRTPSKKVYMSISELPENDAMRRCNTHRPSLLARSHILRYCYAFVTNFTAADFCALGSFRSVLELALCGRMDMRYDGAHAQTDSPNVLTKHIFYNLYQRCFNKRGRGDGHITVTDSITSNSGAARAHVGLAPTRSAAMMADRLAPLLLLFLFLEPGGVKATLCSNDTTLHTKLDLMLAEYERQTLPARAEVQVLLAARHATLREDTATLRLLADLAMKWQDDRLSWNTSDWNCDVAHVDAERIWLPDVVALTSGAISGTAGDPQKAQLASSGAIDWTMRLDISTPCALDLAKWPSDTQSCNIQFGSRNFNADYLNLTLGNDEMVSFQLVAAAWKLVSTQAFTNIQEREYDTYSVVSWTVKLMRRAPAHKLVCQVVITAIVLQIIAAAILSPASRPPLCASAALVATIWMTTVLLRLPAATTIPGPLSLMAGMLILSCIAALAAAFVQRVARLRSPPPYCARRLVVSAQAYITTPTQVPEGAVPTWICFAQLLDAVLLCSFAVVVGVLIVLYS